MQNKNSCCDAKFLITEPFKAETAERFVLHYLSEFKFKIELTYCIILVTKIQLFILVFLHDKFFLAVIC